MFRHGGYSDYLMVPHPRYLFDIGDLPPERAAPLACSGLTTFSALKKVGPTLTTDPTVIIGAGPAVGAAMVIGIVIALIQALTQIQEVTLTFIPKIIAILVVALVTGSFVGSQIFAFTELVYGRIVTGF